MMYPNGFLFEAIRHVNPSIALTDLAQHQLNVAACDDKGDDMVTTALTQIASDRAAPPRPKLWSEVERSLPNDPVIIEAVRRKGARERVMSRMCDQMQGGDVSGDMIWGLAKRVEMVWGIDRPVYALVMSAALALVYEETLRQIGEEAAPPNDKDLRMRTLAYLCAKVSVVRDLLEDGSGGWMGLAGEMGATPLCPHDYLNMTGRDLPRVQVWEEGNVKWRCGREEEQGERNIYIPSLSASIQINSILRPWVENRVRRCWLELYERPAQVEHNPDLAEELESLDFVIGCGVLHAVRWYAPDVCTHVHKMLNPPPKLTPEEEEAAIDG